MITLYGFGRVHPMVHGFTRDLRVLWTLEETGLPYRVHPVDHNAGETKSDAFAAINPFQQLPVLDDDGYLLTESGAIVLYLAEKAGQLIPADAKGRAQVMRWCFTALTTLEPSLVQFALQDPNGVLMPGAQEQRAGRLAYANLVLGRLERALAGKQYLANDAFTVADILMSTVLRYANNFHLLTPYARVQAYRERCIARPSWARALAGYEARLGDQPGTLAV